MKGFYVDFTIIIYRKYEKQELTQNCGFHSFSQIYITLVQGLTLWMQVAYKIHFTILPSGLR